MTPQEWRSSTHDGSINKMGEQYNPETGKYEALGAAKIARFFGIGIVDMEEDRPFRCRMH